MNQEIEKLRQRMVPGSQVVGLPRYPVDDIKKGQKYATALPRWISGDTYEGQMYIIDIATEDIKGNSEDVVLRPYAKSVLKYFTVAEVKKQDQPKQKDRIEDIISDFIVNKLGINLCAVKSIDVDRQTDEQIKQIKIEFIPAKKV